jgi:hypothetical protein
VQYLALVGSICFGPTVGKSQAIVLFDEWAPGGAFDAEAGLVDVVRRYITSHGPATVDDFRWWAKLPATDVKRALAACRDDLVELACDGREYWMDRELFETLDADDPVARRSVLALAGFDEHLLGYADRSAMLQKHHGVLVVPGGNGMFRPTIVSGGVVVGTWKRSTTAKATTITAEPFGKLNRTVARSFEAAAERYGAFLGTPTSVQFN